MTTHRGNTIELSRRAFAASLLASGALGIGIGEVAAPLAASQAHPVAVAANAPAACASFAVNVGHAFTILGTILEDASKYPALIPAAEQAGETKSAAKAAAITAKLNTLNAAVQTQASRFSALKTPILSEENSCLR
jgi:hypothetical protein